MTYPTDVISDAPLTGSDKQGTSSPRHRDRHNNLVAGLAGVQTKVGTGSSTAASDTVFEATGTGASAWVKRASAHAYHGSAQSIATGTWTSLAMNSERFDTDVIHDTVTNNTRLTCKTAGKYLIVGAAAFAPNTTGYRMGRLLFNGATVIDQDFKPPVTGDETVVRVVTLYQLAVNDYVEFQAWQSSGGALNVDTLSSYSPEFMMARVAA